MDAGVRLTVALHFRSINNANAALRNYNTALGFNGY